MKRDDNGTPMQHDYLIIGAGPAGLQLGYYLEKAGRDYLILEAGDAPGTFFKTYPRHRKLISSNKVYTGYDDPAINMRFDWNSLLSDAPEMLFKNYSREYFPSAEVMVQYLGDFAAHFNLKVNYGVRVEKVSKDGDLFEIVDSRQNIYTSRRLVIATGFMKPYVPAIPGIELAENYTDVNVDPDDFINQHVLIIGKGNSGFETADNLISTAAVIHLAGPTPINMAWKTHFVGHVRAVNNNILDTYQLKSQNGVIDGTIESIEKRDGKFVTRMACTHADGEQIALTHDRVIICTGFRFDDSIFDGTCRPELVINDRFPAQTSEWESTNVPDLYFAGTLTQACDFKKTTSGFIHGFRYNILALHRLLEQKYHENEWPRVSIPPTPEGLADAVIKRINVTSALWQQFGFLGDLIIVPEDGGAGQYYEEIPVAYVHDSDLGRQGHYYIVTLEFGKITGDPFNIPRYPDPRQAERSTFLHPIIRRFAGPDLVAEHHILEDFYGEWKDPDVHVKPLLEFFETQCRQADLAPTG